MSHWTGVMLDQSARYGARMQKLKALELAQANANPEGMGIDTIIRLLIGIFEGE